MDQNLQLIVPNGGSVDATMKLMWCLTPALSASLAQAKAKNPMIVFQVSPIVDSDSEYAANTGERQIVPLDRLQNYFWFRRPGKHLITAFIVSGGITKKQRKELFERKADGGFKYPPQDRFSGVFFRNVIDGGDIEIEVSERFFAKAPPAWLSSFANLPYEDAPRDQCHFRKRLLTSPFVTPFFVLLVLFINVVIIAVKEVSSLGVVLALLIAGRRDINLSPLRHPWDLSPKDVYSNIGKSVFLFDSQGDQRGGILPWLYPPRILVVLGVMYGVLWIGLGKVAIAIVVILFFAWLGSKDQEKEKTTAEMVKEAKADEAYYMSLTCLPSKSKGALPQPRKTVALVVQEIKVKVCRPYAV